MLCTECIASGNWDKNLSENPCKICTGRAGAHRQFSWAPFKYEKTSVDMQYRADDPIRDFTRWVLTNFKREKNQKKKQKGKKKGQQVDEVQLIAPENEEEKEVAIETLVYSHYGGR